MAAALAVDLGSIALDARRLQGAADLAAMAAVTNLSAAQTITQRTADQNSANPVHALAVLGRYQNDRTLAPTARFKPGTDAADAVRVTLKTDSRLFFGSLILRKRSIQLTRSATATAPNRPMAAFSIGSRLASLDGGLANQLLGALTGSTVNLSLMDYRALADADVDLLTFVKALSTELDLKVGDYESLLDREVDTGRLLSVLKTLAGPQASSVLTRLGNAAGRQTLRIGDLIAVEPGGEDILADGLNVRLSALDVAMAALEIGAGDRQVALNVGARPGLAEVDVDLAIGERPNNTGWITVARSGQPVIRTAQARLYVQARTSQKLSGLAQVNLPLIVELAASEARLNRIDCGVSPAVTLGVRPGLAQAYLGSINPGALKDFKRPLAPRPATLLSVLGLVTIKAQAHVEAGNLGFTPLAFSNADITAGRSRSVKSTQLSTALASTLLQRLSLDIDVLGLGLSLDGLTKALGALLAPLGPVLDGVLNPVLDLLGLKFGEADVAVHAASCHPGRPRLVG